MRLGWRSFRALARRLAAAALCCAVVGCAASAESRRDRDTLVILEAGDANTLNPLYANNYYSLMAINWFLFEGLTGTGDDFRVIPWLATSWTHTADNLHWTFTLRPGVKWSDGEPFTAKDVVFTWKIQLDPKTGFLYAGQFDYIKHVAALDPLHVRFDLKTTNALFLLEGAGAPILPEHILGKFPADQQRSTSFAEHPVGTGPYVLAKWAHDEESLYRVNPLWWHGTPRVKQVDVRVVLDDQARVEAISTGGADFLDGAGAASYATLRSEAPHLKFMHLPDLYVQWILPNLAVPALKERAVRQAMLYGWDRQALVNGLLHGDGEVANGVVAPALKAWYDPHTRTYPYDPARARALLDGAGWKLGPDGVRAKGKERLALVLSMPSGGAAGADLAADFQADMKTIGIAIVVKSLDYATFIDQTNERKFQLAYTGWGGTPDPDQYTLLNSTQLPPAGNNDMGYKNALVDKDTVMGLKLVDDAARKPYYDELQRETAEDPPEIYAYYLYYRAAYHERVHFDVAKALPDAYVFRDVWNWRLDPP